MPLITTVLGWFKPAASRHLTGRAPTSHPALPTAVKPNVAPTGQDTGRLKLSPTGEDWIIDFETGGREYYAKELDHPTWPEGDSGVTIGVGYDLGYNTKAEIRRDWAQHLPGNALLALESVAGIKGARAEAAAKRLAWINIPWKIAVQVFETVTLPKFSALAAKTFPGMEALPPPAQDALLSIVFNRGGSMKGSRRSEMRAIRDMIIAWQAKGEQPGSRKWVLQGIAAQIRSMKRLWPSSRGLRKRRDAEAERVESAI